jgi:hypothetical protein
VDLAKIIEVTISAWQSRAPDRFNPYSFKYKQILFFGIWDALQIICRFPYRHDEWEALENKYLPNNVRAIYSSWSSVFPTKGNK